MKKVMILALGIIFLTFESNATLPQSLKMPFTALDILSAGPGDETPQPLEPIRMARAKVKGIALKVEKKGVRFEVKTDTFCELDVEIPVFDLVNQKGAMYNSSEILCPPYKFKDHGVVNVGIYGTVAFLPEKWSETGDPVGPMGFKGFFVSAYSSDPRSQGDDGANPIFQFIGSSDVRTRETELRNILLRVSKDLNMSDLGSEHLSVEVEINDDRVN